ncbi:DUF3006 domain-containing protein [Clostridium septicum]|uniref:DUF3006 domain-containing protein n=1 Tax=Clostridium septicum TaxID=1504 RepID=A0A9N7PLP9_CLOSE|nr:DUF3006 domain-containing protein [Clostridium septicum]AYE34067.1 DUF3006 domain-containing protein [Clostridium septicum]MDU1313541.1 DUF3006 domain-containing protein [Clostridium septicum]QAS59438.1 DUF3006 domain-containing protein [Clostridium septicum]UEC21309.1 DUF3006 domain-containing protein [Clostridium septicum]USS00647.1 DUF3006 domain-containing protein [Clostridium septicum]
MDSFIIDRIEENYVVLETEAENIININKDLVKGNFNEGDVLIKKGDIYIVDPILTKNRRDKIKNMMKGMWDE